MNTSHDIRTIRLTSSEIAELYVTYMNDSAEKCVFSYFLNKVEDKDVQAILEFAFTLSEKHLKTIEDIFKTVNHPIPYGFSEYDFNKNAEKLFSDSFMLQYIKFMATFGTYNYAEALAVCAGEDVRNFFTDSIQSSVELSNKANDVLLSKGLYIRPPYIDIREEAGFARKQSCIHGILGDKRPLNALEITQIFINLQTNIIGKAFTMGLSQTIANERVRDYVLRGKEIAEKHVNVFSDMLKDSELPATMTFDSEVFKSTEPVFSDKLIMFHIAGLIGFSRSLYGNAISKAMRSDVITSFIRLLAENSQYAKDGIDIMIDNQWLEKIPETADRKELTAVK